ncbi:hypothetical protein INR76_07690 [Marixanthomonas sp. SCSIO 43207]|uniref:hypothetical protein n=1 Tax=Marixanthomonas sp. SCSIO 43207 TaxID=2779360 RepID=UPI001CA811C2|nr:hypothetical protein [Marixanthomonas sp. SCSIO 43207]UAB80021.1 hypothetical protein INR76_07690 [Marixanthomonas sp. SCSIO 43207]
MWSKLDGYLNNIHYFYNMLAKHKSYIALFLFAAFMLVRVVNVHAFSHLDEEHSDLAHCELCDAFKHSEKDIKFIPQVSDVKETTIGVFEYKSKPIVGYDEPLQYIATPLTLHNKPPPKI